MDEKNEKNYQMQITNSSRNAGMSRNGGDGFSEYKVKRSQAFSYLLPSTVKLINLKRVIEK